MHKSLLPIYQIQDFNAQIQKENYFYFSSLANHLKEHLFIREPHKHNFYIVLFITQGSGTHTIDFNQYEVKPDMFFFMIPGQVHSWQLSDDADGYVLFFTQEFYLNTYPFRKLYDFPFFNALLHKPTLFISQPEKDGLMQLIKTLQTEYMQHSLMKNDLLCSLLEILLIHLTRIHKTQGTETESSGSELSVLQALENLIDKHFKEHLPVTFYADQLNVTSKHLKDICKRALGKTTNELIQERSLLEAQRLLVHSELTSSQIGAELGYFDSSYFSRFFKKHTDRTPEQFRSLNR